MLGSTLNSSSFFCVGGGGGRGGGLEADFALVLKDIASQNGVETDVLSYGFSIVHKGVCAVLCKLQTDIYSILHAASPLPAPSASTVFRWFSHFSGENSAVKDIKGKMKNKTK